MAAWKASVSGSSWVRRRSSTGVRSAPPPNHAFVVTTKRVFMWTAGTCGLCMWAISEMPEAQKRGSSAAPGMSLRNSGANSPNTVDTWTPTFSNTRPFISDITPPPPSRPLWSARLHGRRTKRPAAPSPSGALAGNASSIASNAAQMRSRRASNQARVRPWRASRSAGSAAAAGAGVGAWRVSCMASRIASIVAPPQSGARVVARRRAGLPHRFADRHGAGHGHIERAQARPHGNAQPRGGGRVHLRRHAGGFTPEHEHVAGRVGMLEIRALGLRGEQDQPRAGLAPPALEGRPRGVPHERDAVEVIHAGAAKGAIGRGKAGRLDDVRLHAQAGTQAQNRPGVLGDVGLVQSDPHGLPRLLMAGVLRR